MKKNTIKKIWLLAILLSLSLASYLTYKIYQYKAYIWLPDYFLSTTENDINKIKNGHVMFLIADHYEPGHGEKGIKKNNSWTEKYKKTVAGIYDDYGNPIQHTWFYPYDHHNSPVVLNLNKLVYDNLGEVEFHWHHGPDTNESFSEKLPVALAWFNSHGAMLPLGPNPRPQFGFVHGNWALDNSGKPDQCGVNRELDILSKFGCYADFTFPAQGFSAQPRKVNSIYYATDTDMPKSYDTGIDATVGSRGAGFMIFEGPIANDWHDLIWDCAAVENGGEFKPHRINIWLQHAPIVKGKPEWLFVKINTHASQSKDVILSDNFREMFFELKKYCAQKGLSLHFVTSREAYNIVKAAEDGLSGNPEQYRDYVLQKPINRVVGINNRLSNITVSEDKIEFQLIEPQKTEFSFKISPVKKISGVIAKTLFYRDNAGVWNASVAGNGEIKIISSQKITFTNEIISESTNINSELEYVVKANEFN